MKDNKETTNIFKESLDSDGFEITRLWEIIVEYQKVIIGLTFVASHYIAINSVEEPAGFYPPYIEKRIVYPELYQKRK